MLRQKEPKKEMPSRDKEEGKSKEPLQEPATARKGLSSRQEKELEQITQDLPRYEGLLKGLNAAIAAAGSDYETVESLLKEQEETKTKVDELTERWCELEDLKES